jgi:hypothetical protein
MNGPRLLPLRSLPKLAVAVACVIACLGSAALSQTEAVMVAIDKMSIGAPPADFQFAQTGRGGPGRWVVVSDATADGGRAIEQTSRDTTDYRFPLAIYKSVQAGNVDVLVRFKAIAGRVDRAGGVAVRLTDQDNYYVVRANALEDNVRFYRVVKGRREQLASADNKVTAGAWHTLGLRAEAERFTVTFDGKQLFTATDRTFGAAGQVALWTKADSVTRFDQIEIRTLP